MSTSQSQAGRGSGRVCWLSSLSLPSPFLLPQTVEEEYRNNQLPLVHCTVARLEMSGLPQEPLLGGPLSNLSENTCDNFCLVLEAIQENLMQYKEIRDELNT